MKHFSRLSLIGVLFISFLLIVTIPAFAQCSEEDPNCPIEPPQSVEVDPNAIEAEGSNSEIEDPGALEAVESDITGTGPAIIDPVPLAPRAAIAPAFGKLTIPMRWQQPTDVSCGVQALGMAFEGLGEGSPSSPLILEHLQTNNMMYDFGTGVEELAFSAQNFGYKGTIPFHNWGLGHLQAELAGGRAPVVALGSNGPGQPGHFVTITGFSPDSEWVSYNDPILGEKVVTIDEFNRLWGLQGNTGVAVRKTVPAGEFDPVPWVAFVAGLMALISQTPWALQRKGIGGRLMAGGSTSRRRTRPVRRQSLGGVPSRAAKAASRRKERGRRRVPQRPRDPSPQMFNDAPPAQLGKGKLLSRTLRPVPPLPDPVDEELPLWKKALVGLSDGWNRAVTGAQGLLGIGGQILDRAGEGAKSIVNYFATTQQFRAEAEGALGIWMHDYVILTQKPGLPAGGPITPALIAMSVTDASRNPVSIVGVELVALIENREVKVSFIGYGGASPWDGRIVVDERYKDSNKMVEPFAAGLVAHELEHMLQRDIADPSFFPAGRLTLDEPRSRIVGDSTNYMEVLAYIVGGAVEYDLIQKKLTDPTLSRSAIRGLNLRLAALEKDLATYTNSDAENATRYVVKDHPKVDVYRQNYLVEQSVPDHRIPPDGWDHWLKEMGFSDDAINHISSIASAGTFEFIDPSLLDPTTGSYSTPTPSPTPSPTPTPTTVPSPTTTPTPGSGPTSTSTSPTSSTGSPSNTPTP